MEREQYWWEKLPEHDRLLEAMKAYDAFQKLHEEEVPCKGCKLCIDWREVEDVLMFGKTPQLPKTRDCKHTNVVTENLSEENKQLMDALLKEMSTANGAYLKVIREIKKQHNGV
jgi:hypothetical protein